MLRICACFALVAIVGCDDGATGAPDAGTRIDATLADGSITLGDGGARDASASSDAAPRDGGAPPLCAGDCDPTAGPVMDGGVGECGPGLTCALRDRVPVCHPTPGIVSDGEPCDADRICGAGLACFALAAGAACAPVCCPGDDSLCLASQRCGGDGMLASGVATSWGRCIDMRSCPLFDTTFCAMREGCYIVTPGGQTACLLAGDRSVGDSCEVDIRNQCAPGLFCAGVGAGRCVRLCSLTDGTACPRDEGRCVAQTYSPADTGVCVLSGSPG